jgi:excisionase family DNA binding protein
MRQRIHNEGLNELIDQEIDMGDALLTVTEAAARLKVGRTTLYGLIADKQLRTIKIGRARRIPESVIDQWIAQQVHEQRDPQTDQ